MDRLAAELARVLEAIMKEKDWKLGRDVALIMSADAIHYGDAGWGGRSYADFGTGTAGHEKAVQRDLDLTEKYLTGSIDHAALDGFLYTCVDRADVTQYLVTWCGRFSVPFGLNVASRLTQALTSRPLVGSLLDYGTSVSEASLDVEGLDGLGTTAPSNLHHFVGYAAIGYR
jgi:hypothetical protein